MPTIDDAGGWRALLSISIQCNGNAAAAAGGGSMHVLVVFVRLSFVRNKKLVAVETSRRQTDERFSLPARTDARQTKDSLFPPKFPPILAWWPPSPQPAPTHTITFPSSYDHENTPTDSYSPLLPTVSNCFVFDGRFSVGAPPTLLPVLTSACQRSC